jgi:hypothetical protein
MHGPLIGRAGIASHRERPGGNNHHLGGGNRRARSERGKSGQHKHPRRSEQSFPPKAHTGVHGTERGDR